MKNETKKTSQKYVTEKLFKKTFGDFEGRFESSARATAKSFADVSETLKNINEVTIIILKEIKTIHEENKYFRQSVSSLNFDGLTYDRKISDLNIRVEKLELNAK
ncbi:MAG: hypothetical protein WAN61_01470 [Minisyncoccia bacterium]